MRLRLACIAFLAGALVGAAACGGGVQNIPGAFSTDWQDDSGSSISAVQQRLRDAELPPDAAIAVGVTSDRVLGSPLEGGKPWQFSAKLSGPPVVAGNLVIVPKGDRLVALDAATGRIAWNVDVEGYRLRGAGDDGERTVLSLSRTDDNSSLLLAIDRSGGELLRVESEHSLGVPAVKAGIAFVPWLSQYVSAIDLKSGDEVGRLLMRERVSHAVKVGNELYFGELSLVRLDDAVGKATAGGAHRVGLPVIELPGKPLWFRDGTVPPRRDSSAYDHIRLFARPTDVGAEVGIDSSRYVATYYRVVMGLDAIDASVRWVQTLHTGVLGGAAAIGGVAVCSGDGKVRLISANSGATAGEINLGSPLTRCVVSAGDFTVPQATATRSTAEQIGDAVQLDDARMVAAQRFLLVRLARLADPEATKILIDLAISPRTPPDLLDETRRVLSLRRTGKQFMLKALEREYDFLSDVVRPPPVGPLADALAAMHVVQAGPLLARHLNDPANSPDDVKRAAKALTKLATAKEYDELRTFFALYRATADNDDLVAATISVADAILAVGGEDGREVVTRAATDPLTRPEIRTASVELLAKRKTPKPTKDEAARPESETQEATEDKTPADETPAPKVPGTKKGSG